jgi:hypothetical protein
MNSSAAMPVPTIAGRAAARGATLFATLCAVQGFYYLVTGVWPLVSIETFQAVTGPKTDHLATGREGDHWLVNTVGVLVTANALVLLLASWRNRPSPEVVLLAVGSALGLAVIDVIFVARDVLWSVYLADAAVELLLVVGWLRVAAGNANTMRGSRG